MAANFFMLRMLNRYRDELLVKATAPEMSAAAERTVQFLQTQAARVSVDNVAVEGGRLQAEVVVENLGGHKLPDGLSLAPRLAARGGAGREPEGGLRIGRGAPGRID